MTPSFVRVNLVLRWLLVFSLFGAFAVFAHAQQAFRSGKILSVGGDGRVSIRSGKDTLYLPLQGIAMPLYDQPGYQECFAAFDKLLRNQSVQYQVVTTEKVKYLRVRIGMEWANIKLIEMGVAWHDHGQLPSESLAKSQAKAKADKVGLWKHDDPIPPWEWPQIRQEVLRKQFAERWRMAREQISEEQRTKASAIIDKAVLAMGGKEKLRGLERLHWEFETAPLPDVNPFNLYPWIIGANAGNPPAQTKPKISLWWTDDEQLRVDLGSNPPLSSLFDPKAMASLSCYLLKDQIEIFYRRQVPDKDPKFEFAEDRMQFIKDQPNGSDDVRRVRRLLLGLLQLYPLQGEEWLLRVAEPTEDDDRPAILVTSRELDSLTPNQPLQWIRLVFSKENGHLAESSSETDTTHKCRFSNVKDFDGLKMWTKVELVSPDKVEHLFTTTTLTPLPIIDQAILSLPKANNKK